MEDDDMMMEFDDFEFEDDNGEASNFADSNTGTFEEGELWPIFDSDK